MTYIGPSLRRRWMVRSCLAPRTFRAVSALLLCAAGTCSGNDAVRVLPEGQVPEDQRLQPLTDLNGYFPFGAFGDGRRSRDELPPIALQRARDVSGVEIEAERAVIVGDSVLDVRCARAHGIASVAVATGFTEARELERAGADWVLDGLSDVAGSHPAFDGSETVFL